MLAVECEDVGEEAGARSVRIGADRAGLGYGRQHLPHAFQRGLMPGAAVSRARTTALDGSRNRHRVVLPRDERRHRHEGNGGDGEQRHQPCPH